MIWKDADTFAYEEGEPALRSCWECNPAHEHLRDTIFLHVCFDCGKYWILGDYCENDVEKRLAAAGMKYGDKTSDLKPGKGDFVYVMRIEP